MSHQSNLISDDILAYLDEHEQKELLCFLTCGSVDDGKSTLIGRLLYDSQMIYSDQLAAITKESVRFGTLDDDVDLALLVDGLQAEREQGITIDVAYRYFSTKKRKFIIADTPGHEQYTRNMATGASTSDLAVILVDARYGIQTQTRRHSLIVTLLGIRHIIVAVNKMDLIDYAEKDFLRIQQDYLALREHLGDVDLQFIPLSALHGDNVVTRSDSMPWYQGPALMEVLESIEIASDRNFTIPRFPVQYVNRPSADFRGYCGTIASGVLHPGDPVTILPAKQHSHIQSIISYEGELDKAFPPMSVTLTLTDEVDVSRGDMIVGTDNWPMIAEHFTAHVIWMSDTALIPGLQYYFKFAAQRVTGEINAIDYRLDINKYEKTSADTLSLNEIGQCQVWLNAPVVFDAYALNKITGAFIIIHRLTNATIAAGMITAANTSDLLRPRELSLRYGHRSGRLYFTGDNSLLIATQMEQYIIAQGGVCILLDTLDSDLATKSLADAFQAAGMICLMTTDSIPTDLALDSILFDCNSQTIEQIRAQVKDYLQI